MRTDHMNLVDGRPRTDFRQLAERVIALRKSGMKYSEIARETGAPTGTVCGIISRVRKTDANLAAVTKAIERNRKSARFTDDPRAKRPDYGRLPLPPAAEVQRSSTWLTRTEET